MVIYVFDDGSWLYDFEHGLRMSVNLPAARIDLDRLYDYKDLTPIQIKACEEALNE